MMIVGVHRRRPLMRIYHLPNCRFCVTRAVYTESCCSCWNSKPRIWTHPRTLQQLVDLKYRVCRSKTPLCTFLVVVLSGLLVCLYYRPARLRKSHIISLLVLRHVAMCGYQTSRSRSVNSRCPPTRSH
ncbi:hypothetical protein OE88DRAFT_524259 [Heliocybe sulcata]|uniref:Uncharacterized protein n=1 Tax=Heliocybe sulcata TaxID=5364 RepID=A0A5C3MSG6_9AGAM|nr:hypothetical protein OE88DRAFT_524259 [Heliocybe sulcata]